MTYATTQSSPEGNERSEPNPDGSFRTNSDVIAYIIFIPWMGSWTKNIEHAPGLAKSYNTQSAIFTLNEFRQQLLPLI